MNEIALVRLDKRSFSVSSLHAESDEKEYWLSQSSQARLQATELLRQLNYGYDPATSRLQRVLEVVKREAS